jgi:hypothetical protein
MFEGNEKKTHRSLQLQFIFGSYNNNVGEKDKVSDFVFCLLLWLNILFSVYNDMFIKLWLLQATSCSLEG